jgi:ferric-dicitrate binding protein FerR (iron transport regulator)
MQVNVLGTSFNINAYQDEEMIRTTLLEGAVAIRLQGKEKRMIPGQQAQVDIADKNVGSDIRMIDDVNTARVTAWKYGAFDFQDAKLKEVMRQLARWYDIEIKYEGGVQNIEFWGKMGKNLSLKQVLKGLEGMGVHFRLEGKQLFVLP